MATEPQIPAETAPKAPHRTILVRTWIRDLIVSLGISAFFIIFLYQPVKVEGTSMLPGLEDQERIFVNKFVYRWEPVSRGDVIVFRYPRDTSKSYIKRIIAVPGDRIAIDKGRVYINGLLLREEYVPGEYRDLRSYPETVISAGTYFVMGDHRSLSSDSRDFGPIEERFVIGKAVFIYWPFDKLGLLK